MEKKWRNFGVAVTALAVVLLGYLIIFHQERTFFESHSSAFTQQGTEALPQKITESQDLLSTKSDHSLLLQSSGEECNSIDECLAKIDAKFMEGVFKGFKREETATRAESPEFAWPTDDSDHIVTSCYGEQRKITDSSGRIKNEVTYAVDLRAREGTPIYAIADSTIIEVSNNAGDCGKKILYLLSGGQGAIRYCHLSEILVTARQRVSKGQAIGKSGSTGFVTAAHLDVKWYPYYPNTTNSADFLCLMEDQDYSFKEGVACQLSESCPFASYT